MEDNKRMECPDKRESDIIFSKAIKAGKRIYYLDVKKNKKEELYLAITESKKVISGNPDDPTVQFEKHKIFLYREDFDKFANGFKEVVDFINESMQSHMPDTDEGEKVDSEKMVYKE